MEALLLGAFLLAGGVNLFYWLFFFSRLAFHRPVRRKPEPEEPVSVILCARNEAENLRRHLPHFLNQSYRSYEVLVVDDNSTDDTRAVLLEFQAKNPILRVLSLTRETLPGKKEALARGIAAARHEFILVSDADCRPAGKYWIRDMQAAIRGKTGIALGYSPYEKREGWLNLFIRYEAFYTAIQYISFALAGMPYMGVGRNLIYRKTLYQRVGGFQRHAHLASGDDDLFVNEAATKTNTTVVMRPTAFVYSVPKRSWRSYYQQKQRHLSTGTRYRPVHRWLLGVLSVSHFGHYFLGAVLLAAFPAWLSVITFIYLVRMGVVTTLSVIISRKLQDPGLGWRIPVLDVVFVVYYLLLAPALLIGKRDQWN